jgi:hypothetical protein
MNLKERNGVNEYDQDIEIQTHLSCGAPFLYFDRIHFIEFTTILMKEINNAGIWELVSAKRPANNSPMLQIIQILSDQAIFLLNVRLREIPALNHH